MSKVNTLCNIQVCKCFHYNTGFSLATYRACLLPESRLWPHSAGPSGCSTPPPSSTRASEGNDNTKVLHTGGRVCILWVSEQWPKQQRHVIQTLSAPHTPAFLTLLVVSANSVVEHYWKHWGDIKCIWSPPSQWGSPKPLLEHDVFTPLLIHFDDSSLTISTDPRTPPIIHFKWNTTWQWIVIKNTITCKSPTDASTGQQCFNVS